MGSCPVCLKSLTGESSGIGQMNMMKNPKKPTPQYKSKGLKGLKVPQNNVSLLPESELVVSTKCGHLFHKLCLRDYLVTFRSMTRQTFVECPICQGRIIMSSTVVVDLKANEGCTEKTDQELKFAEIMNKELRGQLEDVEKKLAKTNMEYQTTLKAVQSLQAREKQNYEKWSVKRVVLKEMEAKKKAVKESEKSNEALKKENLKLAGIYLNMITKGYKNAVPKEIPHPLHPYLRVVQENRSLLKRFVHILAPVRFKLDKLGNLGHVPGVTELTEDIMERIRILNPTQAEMEYGLDGVASVEETLPPESNGNEPEASIFTEFYTDEDFEDESLRAVSSRSCLPESMVNEPPTPPPENIRPPNHFLPGVHTVQNVMVADHRDSGSSQESLDNSPDFSKQRKYRSKITGQKDKSSTKAKIYAEQGVKIPKSKIKGKFMSATTILVSPNADYSKLVRTNKPIVEMSMENPHEENHSSGESFRDNSEHEQPDDVDNFEEDNSPKKIDPISNIKPSLVDKFDGLKGQNQSFEIFFEENDEDFPRTPPKQLVSTGCQMSSHDFWPESTTAKPSSMNLLQEICMVLPFCLEDSKPVSACNGNMRENTSTPPRSESPEYEIRPDTASSLVPYSSSGSSSCTNPSSPVRTESHGFNVEHLSIIDYFSHPQKEYPLTGLSSNPEISSQQPDQFSNNNVETLQEHGSCGHDEDNNPISFQESQCFTVMISSDSDRRSDDNESDWETQSWLSKSEISSEGCKEKVHRKVDSNSGFDQEISVVQEETSIPEPEIMPELKTIFSHLDLKNTDSRSDSEIVTEDYQGQDSGLPGESLEHSQSLPEFGIQLIQPQIQMSEPLLLGKDQESLENLSESVVENELSMSELKQRSMPNIANGNLETLEYTTNSEPIIPLAKDLPFMLDLTEFPPPEELTPDCNFLFPSSEIPLPLDLYSLDELPECPPQTHSHFRNPQMDTVSKPIYDVTFQPFLSTPREICSRTPEERPKTSETHVHVHIHPTFSQQMLEMMTLPPTTNPHRHIPTNPQYIHQDFKDRSEFSLFEWFPEPVENRGGLYRDHPEIKPEIALIIQAQQASQLRNHNPRPILKIKRTKRRDD